MLLKDDPGGFLQPAAVPQGAPLSIFSHFFAVPYQIVFVTRVNKHEKLESAPFAPVEEQNITWFA